MSDMRIPVSPDFVQALRSAYGTGFPQTLIEAEVILRVKDGPEQKVPGCLVTELDQEWRTRGSEPLFWVTVYGELPRD